MLLLLLHLERILGVLLLLLLLHLERILRVLLLLLLLHLERIFRHLLLLLLLHLEGILLVLLHLRVLHVWVLLHVRVLLHLWVHHVRVLRHLVWVLLRHLWVWLLHLNLLLSLCLLLVNLLKTLLSLLSLLGFLDSLLDIRLLHLLLHLWVLGDLRLMHRRVLLMHRALGLFVEGNVVQFGDQVQRATITATRGTEGRLGASVNRRLGTALIEGAHFDGLWAVEDDGRGHRERALAGLLRLRRHSSSTLLCCRFGQGALSHRYWLGDVRDLRLELQGTVVCGRLGSGMLHRWGRGRGSRSVVRARCLVRRGRALLSTHVVREVEAQVKVAIVAKVSGESGTEIERGPFLYDRRTWVFDVGGSSRSSSCEGAASSASGLKNGQWALRLGGRCGVGIFEVQVEVQLGGLHLGAAIFSNAVVLIHEASEAWNVHALGAIEVALVAHLEVTASVWVTSFRSEAERILVLLVAQADEQLLGRAQPALPDHGVVLALRQDGVAVEGCATEVGNRPGGEIEPRLLRDRALNEARKCTLAIDARQTERRGLRLGLRHRCWRRCNYLPLVGLRGGWVQGASRLSDCAVRRLRAAWLRLGLWSTQLRRCCKGGWLVSSLGAEVRGHFHSALLVSSLEATAKCGRELVHVLLIDSGCVRDGWQLRHVQVWPD